jgi:hypothetical protein
VVPKKRARGRPPGPMPSRGLAEGRSQTPLLRRIRPQVELAPEPPPRQAGLVLRLWTIARLQGDRAKAAALLRELQALAVSPLERIKRPQEMNTPGTRALVCPP